MNRPRNDPRPANQGWPYWTCYGATVASAMVSLGYSLAATRTGGLQSSEALYATSRSAALAALVVSVPRWRSGPVLLAAAATMTVVQALDAVVGLTVDDTVKVAGPAGNRRRHCGDRHPVRPVPLSLLAVPEPEVNLPIMLGLDRVGPPGSQGVRLPRTSVGPASRWHDHEPPRRPPRWV